MQEPKFPPVVDPGVVNETYANGPFNVVMIGPYAQITFTNVRPNAKDLFDGRENPPLQSHVVARILVPASSFSSFRRFVDEFERDGKAPN